ncbi:predicted protein [Uncinocarpus reesii 1704]|uniref:Uncharacterized protein n=1 Tax=Uncinocarpus reesii (strain UAMH 1704) TaxID=336963 RepID=C4JWZ0_UNCRE|nr:uncharacterized protein UREG_06163 [Uncinocarpus reesii 1704]EEP81298.1 predicted protein [Uncinocarpus reesii 1704]
MHLTTLFVTVATALAVSIHAMPADNEDSAICTKPCFPEPTECEDGLEPRLLVCPSDLNALGCILGIKFKED